jgi:hypothetical protein
MMASFGKSILLTATHSEFFRPGGLHLREALRLIIGPNLYAVAQQEMSRGADM